MRRPGHPSRRRAAPVASVLREVRGFGEHVVPHHCGRPMRSTVPPVAGILDHGDDTTTLHRAWECSCGALLSLVLAEPDPGGAA